MAAEMRVEQEGVRWRERLSVAIVVLLSVAVACRDERSARPAKQPRAAAARELSRPVVVRLKNQLKTLNYVLHTDDAERIVLSFVYEPLIGLNADLQPVPALAARWEISGDHRTYTLDLDPRATFSDGRPVLASDVVFTLNKIVTTPSIQFASWFDAMDREQTKALDERTVRVVFKQARVAQLLAFTVGVMPEHVFGRGDLTKNDAVVGSGPYVVKRRDAGGVLLEARENYWREKPSVRSLLFRTVADDGVAWLGLGRGDLDAGQITNDTWVRAKADPELRTKLRFVNVWLLSYNCIGWNLKNELFREARVRRALAMAFDRPAVIESLYHGEARAVTGPFTPDQWANDPNVEAIEFNPAGARAELAAAGWRDSDKDGVLDRNGKPFAFTLLIPTGNAARDQAVIFQAALQKLGLRMEIATMEGAAFFDRVLAGNFEAAFFSWVNEPDPDPFGLFHSSQKAPSGLNVGGYESARADELMERARVEFDPARRAALYHELHAILARDQPYLWIVQVATKWAVATRLQNVQPSRGVGLFHHYPGPFAWRVDERKGRF